MNRYPAWKYALILVVLLIGVVYTLPNFFGESPAVQVSSGKATLKLDTSTLQRVEEVLKSADLKPTAISFDGNSIKARFTTTDEQLKAKDALQRALIPNADEPSYIVALNLLSSTPQWLTSFMPHPCIWVWICAVAFTS